MVARRVVSLSLLILSVVLAVPLFAQKGGGGGQANPQASQATPSSQTAGGGGSQGLQGFSYAPEEWPQLTLPSAKNPIRTIPGRTVLCYKLTKANSGTQPFILQKLKLPSEVAGTGFDRPCGGNGAGETDSEGRKKCRSSKPDDHPNNHWNACSPLDEKNALLMGQELVIGIDVSDLSDSGGNINQLKLLNINVTTQQSTPLNPSPIRPSFPGAAGAGATTSTGSAQEAEQAGAKGGWWTPLPNRPAGWDGKSTWKACTEYHKGTIVADWTHSRFYRANRDFNSGPFLLDPFPRQRVSDRIADGSVIWQEMNEPADAAVQPKWEPGKVYERGQIVKVLRGGGGTDRAAAVNSILLLQGTSSFSNLLAQVSLELRRALNVDELAQSAQVGASSQGANAQLINRANAVPSYNSPSSSCDTAPKAVGPPEWQYYWAVKRGTSGSVPADPFSIRLMPRAIYIPWPYQLPGDVIPSFTVNLVYTPPVPGAPWQGDTFYPAGSVVTSTANSGHYYTALTGGFSDREPKEPDFPVDAPPTVEDGNLVWLDSGTSAPSVSAASSQPAGQGGGQNPGGGAQQQGGASGAGKPQQWLAKSHYMLGDVVLDPYNGHYFTMVRSTGGKSGSNSPFQPLASTTTLHDGDLLLLQTDKTSTVQWQAGAHHQAPEVLNIEGTYYQVIGSTATTGNSSKSYDSFPPPKNHDQRPQDGDVIWQASGPARPYSQTWKQNNPYSFGDTIKGSDGILYVMVGTAGGNSGSAEPETGSGSGRPATVPDGDLLWMPTAKGKAKCTKRWVANTYYKLDAKVCSGDLQEYQMIRYTAGTSGPSPRSPFPVAMAGGAANQHPYPRRVSDGTITWVPYSELRPWRPDVQYEQGAVVYAPGDPDPKARYWIALNTVASGGSPIQTPLVPHHPCAQPEFDDDGRRWGCEPLLFWKEGIDYHANVLVASNDETDDARQLWQATNSGTSGPTPAQPAFPIFEPRTVIEPKSEVGVDAQGHAVWEDSGAIRPIGLPPGDPTWVANRDYNPGDVVFVPGPGNGRYYTALSSSTGQDPRTSPMSYQNFPLGYPQLPVTWQDSGTMTPSTVASGQPADQTVSLVNAPLPQTHSLSYFNIAAGVVVPFYRPPVFGFVSASSLPPNKLPTGFTAATSPPGTMTTLGLNPMAGGCTVGVGTKTVYSCPEKVGKGSYPVDPVLALTVYYPPVDAETPWRWRNVKNWIPGGSFAFSLANPTSNFYLGGSNEFLVRNVQVFYGWAFVKTATEIGPATSQSQWGGFAGPAPAVSTKQGFGQSLFVGFTFNLSGFVQTLGFGGSKAQ